jgi:hypothetical protein
MQILAILAFTAVLGFALFALLETLAVNGRKIMAALRGASLLAEPMLVTRPVTIRVLSRRVSRPVVAMATPRLRAAA